MSTQPSSACDNCGGPMDCEPCGASGIRLCSACGGKPRNEIASLCAVIQNTMCGAFARRAALARLAALRSPKCHQCEATLIVCGMCNSAWCADHGPVGLACPKCGSRPGDETKASECDKRFQLMRPDGAVLLVKMMTPLDAKSRNTILRNKGNGTFWVEVK